MYTDEEIAHERLMTQLGEEKYFLHAAAARQNGQMSLTPPGRALMRLSLQSVQEELFEWMGRASAGPAHNALALPCLEMMKLEAVSLLAATCIIDSITSPFPLTGLAIKIGKSLEDEARFSHLKKANPGLWRSILKDTKHSGPVHRRRVAVFRGGRSGDLPLKWTLEQRTQLGSVCIHAFLKGTGMIEIQKVKLPRKQHLQQLVFPTEALLDWVFDADDRASTLSPVYLPTICPPADWEGVDGGGYLTDVVLRRPIARFRSKFHENRVRQSDPQTDWPVVLQAVNRLQAVPWKINENTYNTLDHAHVGWKNNDESQRHEVDPKDDWHRVSPTESVRPLNHGIRWNPPLRSIRQAVRNHSPASSPPHIMRNSPVCIVARRGSIRLPVTPMIEHSEPTSARVAVGRMLPVSFQ